MAMWQLQEAKTKLSEVIERAIEDGPQTITRHGKPRAVVVSVEEYERLDMKSGGSGGMSFKEFLLSGPKFDDLDQYMERSKDAGREIDLE